MPVFVLELERIAGLIVPATLETLGMVLASLVFSHIFGVPIGILLVLTGPGGIRKNKAVNAVLGTIVNVGRSIPFVILMVAIIPFTRLVTGSSIGPVAAVVPLTVAAIPFVARLTEAAMLTVEPGVIDACISMGATASQIVRYVLIPESLPSLISGAAITAVNLVGYSAMAGAVGGGGLGDLAIRYGYQRWQPDVMFFSVVVLVAMVQGIQYLGDKVSRKYRRR
ncbi:MAG TPA: ABC transporter permease [Firmicutes bacterium]|nr:ABC transporter permease [Candidatus Fermentithermobacillaceae bacterium]